MDMRARTRELDVARAQPWWILAGAVLLQGASAPGQTVGVSVFVDDLAHDLDLSRSAVSTAYMMGTLTGALAMPTVGRMIDRRGLRAATLAVGVAFGAVLVAMAGVVGFATLALGFAGTRLVGQGSITLVSTTSVAIWFDQHRGLATGIRNAAGGALMAIVPLGSSVLVGGVGWRAAWVVLGLCAWAIVLPIGLWVMRSPEPGDHPDAPASPGDSEPTTSAASTPVHLVLRHPAFWAMTGALGCSALVVTALMFHHVDLMAGRGLDTGQAAAVFLPMTLSGALASVVAGRLADRIAPRLVAAAAVALLALSTAMVRVVEPGAIAVAYGVVLGASGGILRTAEATALPRWFGVAHIGQIRGVVMTVAVGASAIGPLALSLGKDLTGSYKGALDLFALGSLAISLGVAVVRPPGTDSR